MRSGPYDANSTSPHSELETNIDKRLGSSDVVRRSASPAKRSAAEMEGREETQEHVRSPADVRMADGVDAEGIEAARSSQEEAAISEEDLDERVRQVTAESMTLIEPEEAGYLVSHTWLSRVFARSSEHRSDGGYPPESTEGPIGAVDNADIAADGGFSPPLLKYDQTKAVFVPIRPDIQRGQDFEVLPEKAWRLIVEWYGLKEGQLPIIRYAKNTAPEDSGQVNVEYELRPTIFTIRKMLSGPYSGRRPPSPPTTNGSSETLSDKDSQSGPKTLHAVRLLASRQDRWHDLLTRAKMAAKIPMSHKVRPWRLLQPLESRDPGPEQPRQALMLTPAASRASSPAGDVNSGSSASLVISKAEFDKLPEGIAVEQVDAHDNTANDKYNGRVNLDTLGLIEDQTLILEEQTRGPAGGEFLSDAKRQKQKSILPKPTDDAATAQSAGPMTRGRTRVGSGRPRGRIGLVNLGNTCYMNSALQCISRIEELADYFLSDHWKPEINSDNPLGYGGQMARAYADLLSALYAANSSSAFRPNSFKGALSRAQPMFSGYGQQDSQEFLSFLVDALHEDLNRVHKKPYRENPDSDDSKVHDPEYIRELGKIYRDNHRARNDSIAMDLFNGFYKNTMVCPECDKISVTFDPYSLLTLQLPVENPWQHKIIFVPNVGVPSRRTVDLDKNATIKALKQYIATKFGDSVRPERLFVAETFHSKIYKIWNDADPVNEIATTDEILVFELPDSPTNISKKRKKQPFVMTYGAARQDEIVPDMNDPMADHMAVTVFMRCASSRDGQWKEEYKPFIVMISREEAQDYDAIFKKVLGGVAKWTSADFLNESFTKLARRGQSSRRGSDSGISSDSGSEPQTDGKLSDRSVPSEDEYINVSMRDGSPQEHKQARLAEILRPGTAIPPAFKGLFEMKYTASPSGDLHCTSSNNLTTATPMIDRVQYTESRRSSITSFASLNSGSSETSNASRRSETTSTTEADTESTLTTGDEDFVDARSEPTSTTLMEPSEVVSIGSRNGRRRGKPNKYGRHNKHKIRGSRMSKHMAQQQRPARTIPHEPDSPDNPYYIKLGEGIVLDWSDEGWDALFGGDPRTESDLRGYMTVNEHFMEVADDPELTALTERRSRRRKDGISVDDCFAETAKTETLSEENAWYCNRCKELRRADKTLMIWTAPDILVIHLKRFSGERYRRDKVDVLVDFPTEGLDLSKRIGLADDGKDYVYDLFAVDNHYGGLGGGHYTAYAKNFFDGKWYDFNDSMVSEHSNRSVVSTAAYLLFYRRRSSNPLGPPYLQSLVSKARGPSPSDSEDELSTIPPASTSSKPTLDGAADDEEDEGISMAYDHRPAPDAPIGKCNGKPMHGPVRPAHLSPTADGAATSERFSAGWNFNGLESEEEEVGDRMSTQSTLDGAVGSSPRSMGDDGSEWEGFGDSGVVESTEGE